MEHVAHGRSAVASEVALSEQGPEVGRIFVALGAFLVVGAPFAAVAWHQLSHLLSGDITAGGLLLMAGSLLVFIGIAVVLRRYVTHLTDGSDMASPARL